MPYMVPKADNGHKKHEETQKTDMAKFDRHLPCFRGFFAFLWPFREWRFQFELLGSSNSWDLPQPLLDSTVQIDSDLSLSRNLHGLQSNLGSQLPCLLDGGFDIDHSEVSAWVALARAPVLWPPAL